MVFIPFEIFLELNMTGHSEIHTHRNHFQKHKVLIAHCLIARLQWTRWHAHVNKQASHTKTVLNIQNKLLSYIVFCFQMICNSNIIFNTHTLCITHVTEILNFKVVSSLWINIGYSMVNIFFSSVEWGFLLLKKIIFVPLSRQMLTPQTVECFRYCKVNNACTVIWFWNNMESLTIDALFFIWF